MKFKLAANAEIDLLTKSEVTDVVQQHMRAALGGVLYRTIPQVFTPANSALMVFKFTPQTGRMWSVKAISVAPKSATDVVQVWKNDSASLSAYVCSINDDGQKGNFQTFTSGALVVQGGETVIVQALTVTTVGYASIRVKEVPAGHDWKL